MKTKTCINLETELYNELREYSKETEIPITRLIARGIRCVLKDRTPKPVAAEISVA